MNKPLCRAKHATPAVNRNTNRRVWMCILHCHALSHLPQGSAIHVVQLILHQHAVGARDALGDVGNERDVHGAQASVRASGARPCQQRVVRVGADGSHVGVNVTELLDAVREGHNLCSSCRQNTKLQLSGYMVRRLWAQHSGLDAPVGLGKGRMLSSYEHAAQHAYTQHELVKCATITHTIVATNTQGGAAA